MEKLNVYAVEISFRGVIKAKSMAEFKKNLLDALGTNAFCKSKYVKGHGTKLNLSASTIAKIIRKAEKEGKV